MALTRTMYSGTIVDLEVPRSDMITLADIAHHLAMTNRFGGAPEFPYSVAQHSVLVAKLLADQGHTPRTCLFGLLHDAHEAYLADLIRPLKVAVFGPETFESDWDILAAKFDLAINAHFHLGMPTGTERHVIAEADDMALATEWRDLMKGPCPVKAEPSPHPVRPRNWAIAHEQFLKRFEELATRVGVKIS